MLTGRTRLVTDGGEVRGKCCKYGSQVSGGCLGCTCVCVESVSVCEYTCVWSTCMCGYTCECEYMGVGYVCTRVRVCACVCRESYEKKFPFFRGRTKSL